MQRATPDTEAGSAPVAAAVAPAPPHRRRRARFGLWLLLALPLSALALVLGMLYVTHQTLPAPGWLVARIEARANAALAGALQLDFAGGAELVVPDTLVPRLRFLDVVVAAADGRRLAVLPEVRLVLERDALLRGQVQVQALRIDGASLELHRLADGSLDVALGGAPALSAARAETLVQALEAFKQVFATPALERLQRIEADGLAIRLDDARLGKVWQVSAGSLTLTQSGARLAVALGFDIGATDQKPSSVALSLTTRKGSAESSFGAAVTALPARDLALQSPALAWLAVLDAPISGSLRSGIDAAGTVGQLDARLEIGAGALSPVPGAAPVPLRGGNLHFTFDPGTARVTFSELAFDSRALRLRATGSAMLQDFAVGLPQVVLAQVAISNLRVAPDGLFENPVTFVQGAADLRLRLDPFTLDLGQVQLIDNDQRISASGQIAAREEGWRLALDLGIGRISRDRMMALWPVELQPRTRDWLAENVATGELRDVKAALRLVPGAEPQLALAYAFEGAEVRVLDSLPPVRDGAGYATIEGNTHALTVERGHVLAPAGGRIDVSDTVMVVPDIRIRPAPAEVRLRSRSSIAAALSLLDQPPFRFMSKAGMATDIAEGTAEAETVLRLILKNKLNPDEVGYRVDARLRDVRSQLIVPGRQLEAAELRLTADPTGMQISGAGTLSGVAFDAEWSLGFGPAATGGASLRAEVPITPQSLAAFGVVLPQGAIDGAGQGQLVMRLPRGAPAQFSLTSDMAGLALRIPELDWRKPAADGGSLTVTGELRDPPRIERFELAAAGLAARGSVTLAAGGALDQAAFPEVTLGSWFTGAVRLLGQGPNRPVAVEVISGTADLRRASFGQPGAAGSGGVGGAARGGPARISLDRLTVTDDIALTNFEGEFTQSGGLSGIFTARVNGGPAVDGAAQPGAEGRSAFRITSQDAGAVMAAAGIFARARGGVLDLTLYPAPGGAGNYEGTAAMQNVRVIDAPVLAELLNAASGIGLLEQLNGEGLLFNQVDGAFRLTPEIIEITNGAAQGASLGVSLAGIYNPGTEEIDMQGVLSPLYLLNSIGQLFGRRGEGLIGISYRLRGTKQAPRISVNPLSLLTPGFLRDIFRRPAPTADQ